MDTNPMTAAEIAVVDRHARPYAASMDTPETVAKAIAPSVAADLGLEVAATERRISRYLSVLARNAEFRLQEVFPQPEELPLPPLRYTTALIEADAIASASCGD